LAENLSGGNVIVRRGKLGGRKRGGHTRGYWYRSGHRWYVTRGGESVKLCDANGNHIELPTAQEEAKTA
jgi:hypothetical protein